MPILKIYCDIQNVLLFTVTKRDIAFQELLLAAMMHSYTTANNMNANTFENFEVISNNYTPFDLRKCSFQFTYLLSF